MRFVGREHMSNSQESNKRTKLLSTTTQDVYESLDRLIKKTQNNILCHGGDYDKQVLKSKTNVEKAKKVRVGQTSLVYNLQSCGFHPKDTGIQFYVAHQHDDIKELMTELFWLTGALAWIEDWVCPEA